MIEVLDFIRPNDCDLLEGLKSWLVSLGKEEALESVDEDLLSSLKNDVRITGTTIDMTKIVLYP